MKSKGRTFGVQFSCAAIENEGKCIFGLKSLSLYKLPKSVEVSRGQKSCLGCQQPMQRVGSVDFEALLVLNPKFPTPDRPDIKSSFCFSQTAFTLNMPYYFLHSF